MRYTWTLVPVTDNIIFFNVTGMYITLKARFSFQGLSALWIFATLYRVVFSNFFSTQDFKHLSINTNVNNELKVLQNIWMIKQCAKLFRMNDMKITKVELPGMKSICIKIREKIKVIVLRGSLTFSSYETNFLIFCTSFLTFLTCLIRTTNTIIPTRTMKNIFTHFLTAWLVLDVSLDVKSIWLTSWHGDITVWSKLI